jgi:DNA-binding response OmpR family regulator
VPSPDISACRVLLVEDNPADAELVEDSLSQQGSPGRFAVHQVSTLAMACAACKTEAYDCIVVDLELPDSSGVEAVRKLHAQMPDVAIVAFSGVDSERLKVAAFEDGAQGFISKK